MVLILKFVQCHLFVVKVLWIKNNVTRLLTLVCLGHIYEIAVDFFDAFLGLRLTVLTTTEDASLSSAKLDSLSSHSKEVFLHSCSTEATLLRAYTLCGASSQDGEELLLSIGAAPNCCRSVPSRNNVAYSDSKICRAYIV